MKGYVIAEIEVTDQNLYDEYRSKVLASMEAYDGRFIARAGRAEALEGDSPKRMIILEFPSYDQAARWYRSAEYAPLLALRKAASRGRLVLVEGA